MTRADYLGKKYETVSTNEPYYMMDRPVAGSRSEAARQVPKRAEGHMDKSHVVEILLEQIRKNEEE